MLVDNQYTARIPVAKSTGANFNQIEEFVFGMDKCHIFDIETEKNLTLEQRDKMKYYAVVDLGGTNTKINNILYYTQNLIN